MTTRTQEILMTLVGVVGVKIVVSGAYLNYVNPYMKWPILLASIVLIAVSLRFLVLTSEDSGEDADRVPAVTWLLLVPVLVLFVTSPPELGAYAAERRVAASAPQPPVNAPTNHGSTAPARTLVSSFVSLAQWEPVENLTYRPVVLTGFVSMGPRGEWFVTRLGISCCAADGVAWRVRVDGAPAPQRDDWVQVTGRWINPHKRVPRPGDPAITADDVRFVKKPKNTYE